MKVHIHILMVLGFMLTLTACKTNLKQKDIKAGSADFSRYVAIGNSMTAGMADGALSKGGQLNSYPVMLAAQFIHAGGGDFKVPYMEEGPGNDGQGNSRRILGYVLPCNASTPILSPVYDPAPATSIAGSVSSAIPFNLIGVPGIKAADINTGIMSLLNPFFKRFCQTPGASTILTEALNLNPTFFTLWLGSNDVLSYAMGGATPPINIFSATLSDTTQVRLALTGLVDTLVKIGAKGAIANVPEVTSAPYFTTIPWNGLVLSKGKADTLNALYASFGLSSITWQEGANGFLIVDSAVAPFIRHATAQDLILLVTPSDSLKCAGWGAYPNKPLTDRYVLDQDELATIMLYTAKHNAAISAIASYYNLALIDMNSALKAMKPGMLYNGITLTSTFVSGGFFSLDGIHPNARGYAMIANEFIKGINAKFGATIPYVDATKYPGIIFPQ